MTNTFAESIKLIEKNGFLIKQAYGLGDDDPDPEGFRTYTGEGHVLVRGAFRSLERIANGEAAPKLAAQALQTVEMAIEKPQWFMSENIQDVAELTKTILEGEIQGSELSEVVAPENVDALAEELVAFNAAMQERAAGSPEDVVLQGYAGALSQVTAYYQQLSLQWKSELAGQVPQPPEG